MIMQMLIIGVSRLDVLQLRMNNGSVGVMESKCDFDDEVEQAPPAGTHPVAKKKDADASHKDRSSKREDLGELLTKMGALSSEDLEEDDLLTEPLPLPAKVVDLIHGSA